MSIRNNFTSFAPNYHQMYSKGGFFMTLYDGSKKIHHWFPKVNHMVDDYLDYNDTPDTVIVENHHDLPYIGDFPPKNEDSKRHFY